MILNGIHIDITKCKRKTASIFIERDGSVSARVPKDLTDHQIHELIQKYEYSIHRNLAEWKRTNERHVDRAFVSGQSFIYFGRNYRLKLTDDEIDGLKLYQGRFWLSKNQVDNAPELFKHFYKIKLTDKTKPIVELYEEKLGVKANTVRVLELKNRWGSCSTKGNINLHWKCAMAPIDILEYIVLHELVHLIHFDHSSDFWRDIEKVMPDYKNKVKWLELNGVGMDL